MGVDELVDTLIATQNGVISRRQARECGLTDHRIRYLVETGTWLQLDTAVFAPRSSTASWHRRMNAALLSRPEALAAGRSAGYLHGFPGIRTTRPEILVPFTGNARSPLARVIRSRHFNQIARASVLTYETTTVAETILTLSFREPWETIERIVDDQLAANRLSVSDFGPIFERLSGARVRGLPMLRRIVGDRTDDAYQPPTSLLERWLYRMLSSPCMPAHERQLPISYPTTEATVDAYIPTWRMIVEGDGRRWHTRKADFDRDRERDNAAAAAGLIVVRFTYRMLKEEPDRCRQVLLDAGKWRVTR